MVLGKFLLCVDYTALGRLDFASLTDQSKMELVVADIADVSRKVFLDKNGLFRDVCTWDGVDCDDRENVVAITWIGSLWGPKEGTINLGFLPETTATFNCALRKFHGVLDASRLPGKLQTMNVSLNRLMGSIDWAALPASLREFYLENNLFSGSLALECLPPSMQVLIAKKNEFFGKINLKALPHTMWRLNISENNLSGTLHSAALPESLKELYMNNAGVGGFVGLENLPQIVQVWAHGCSLEGPVRMNEMPTAVQKLSLRRNRLSGSFLLSNGQLQLQILNLSENQMIGSLKIQGLPPTLRQLDLSSNKFSGEIFIDIRSGLQHLLFQNNHLCGMLQMRLPVSVARVDASRNQFEPQAIINAPGPFDLTVDKSVSSIVDSAGKPVVWY